MKERRKTRYQEKIDFIQEKIEYFDVEPDKKLVKWGLYYAVQTSIESLYDLIAMLVKDMGLQVKDDEYNVDILLKERKLSPDLAKQLKEAKGMRNIIVHQYNGVDENIIMESLPRLKNLIEKWLTEIELILSEIET